MEVVTSETPLDVLSRAACMLEYTTPEADVEQAGRSPTAVKRSFADVDLNGRVPPPCLPASVHHHPCRPHALNSPPSLSEYSTVGCSSISASKFPRLDGECDSPGGARGSSTRNTSVAEADTTRKCAATQTFFSSFPYSPPDVAVHQRLLPPPYPSEPRRRGHHIVPVVDCDEILPRPALDFDRISSSRPFSSTSSSSSSFQTSWSTMTIADDDDDLTNVPLNLTKKSIVDGGKRRGVDTACWNNPDDITSIRNPCVTSSGSFWKPPASSSLSLPPWINRESSAADTEYRAYVSSNGQRLEGCRTESSPCPHRREQQKSSFSVVNVECDREIEEHFQRSLGRDYPRFLSTSFNASPSLSSLSSTAASPPTYALSASMTSTRSINSDVIPPKSSRSPSSFFDSSCDVIERNPANMSVAGTVDDHFAKSLGGATWNRIKETIDVTQGGGCGRDMRLVSTSAHGSVDDHFAKALGDTWFKIKADSESV